MGIQTNNKNVVHVDADNKREELKKMVCGLTFVVTFLSQMRERLEPLHEKCVPYLNLTPEDQITDEMREDVEKFIKMSGFYNEKMQTAILLKTRIESCREDLRLMGEEIE